LQGNKHQELSRSRIKELPSDYSCAWKWTFKIVSTLGEVRQRCYFTKNVSDSRRVCSLLGKKRLYVD